MGAAFLQDLVVVMVVAAAATILFYRLKLPVVLGYLLAGLLVGPFTPPVSLITNEDSIHALAELGVIFLMFAVGLEFNFRKLRKVGFVAVLGATLEIALMMSIGYATGRAFGWSPMDSIYLGAILSMSSTMIIVKVLMEMGLVEREFAQVAFGILIVEDLVGIILVAVLPGFAATGGFDPWLLGAAVAKVLIFVLIALSIGIVFVPRLIEWVNRFNAEEVIVITVVGLAFLASLTSDLMGFSLALGAFLIGAIIAESRAVRSVEHKVVPIRDLFSAVFFVAVGMLIDPRVLLDYWLPILVITAVTVVGKIVSDTIAVIIAGYHPREAMHVGFSMAQIGEFSFIVAGIGIATGTMSAQLYPIAVAVCGITTLFTPFLIRWADPVTTRMGQWLPASASTFGEWYRRQVARMRATAETRHPREARGRRSGRVVIYAAWLLGLFIAGAYVSLWLAGDVTRALTPSENAQRAMGLLFLGLFALPLVVAFTKATEEWSRDFARARALNPQRLARPKTAALGPHVVARVIAGAASVALLALAIRIAWGVHPLALPATWLTALVMVVITGTGALLWRRLDRAYHIMEETLDLLLGHGEEEAAPLQRVRSRYPFGVDADEVAILPHSWGAYTSLRDLALQERTGVTIISIERDGTVIASPHPDLALLPGDRVVIVGKRNQLDQASRLLHERWTPEETRRAEPTSVEFRLPPSSPVVGMTLAQSGVKQKTGATVASVVRKSGHHVPPSAGQRLEAGDRLTLFGTPDEVERARRHLGVRDEHQPRPRDPPRGEHPLAHLGLTRPKSQ